MASKRLSYSKTRSLTTIGKSLPCCATAAILLASLAEIRLSLIVEVNAKAVAAIRHLWLVGSSNEACDRLEEYDAMRP